MARNCKARAHRNYWVANVCLACLIPVKPREWSPLWREARYALYVLLALGFVITLMIWSY